MRAVFNQLAEAWRARALLGPMIGREISARFAGTALGLVWLYAQPLLTIAAYYAVFDLVLKARLGAGAPIQAVGVYLIIGMVPWMGFSDAVARAMGSLVESGPLLQKNALSPVLFPLRAVIASALTFVPPLLVVLVVFAATHGAGVVWLLLPIVVALQLVLHFVLGYALAILTAALRDIAQVVGFALTLGVFASPILFTPEMIPEAYRWVLWLNPMTPLILAYQSLILVRQLPDPQVWLAVLTWIGALALLLDRMIERSREHLVDWL